MSKKFLNSIKPENIFSALFSIVFGVLLIIISIFHILRGDYLAYLFIPFSIYWLILAFYLLKVETFENSESFPILSAILRNRYALIGYVVTCVPAAISAIILSILFIIHDALENAFLYFLILFIYVFCIEMIREFRLKVRREKNADKSEFEKAEIDKELLD